MSHSRSLGFENPRKTAPITGTAIARDAVYGDLNEQDPNICEPYLLQLFIDFFIQVIITRRIYFIIFFNCRGWCHLLI